MQPGTRVAREVEIRRSAGLSVEALLEYTSLKGHLKGKTLLDVGCGPGMGAVHFACRGYRVVGLDVNPAMLSAARELGLDCVRASAEAIPFREGSFDNTMSIHVLEHVPDPVRMISEMRRASRHTVAIVTPNADYEHEQDADHLREFSIAEMTELLRDGFGDACFTVAPLKNYFYVSNDPTMVPPVLEARARALFKDNHGVGLLGIGFADASRDPALLDSFWRGVVKTIQRAEVAGESVTGNLNLRNFAANYRYPLCIADDVSWVVVHKGRLERITRPDVEALFSGFEPIVANEVFVVFARKGHAEPLEAGNDHYRALVHKLVERGFAVKSPPLYASDDVETVDAA